MQAQKSHFRIVATIWGEGIYKKSLYAKNFGAHMLEIRLDKIKEEELKGEIERIKSLALPLILTIRRWGEGGEFMEEKERERLYKEWIREFHFIDVELYSRIRERIVKEARKLKKSIIISYHNLSFTPHIKTLKMIIKKAKKAGADIVKVATKPNKAEDIRKLFLLPFIIKRTPLAIMSLGKEWEWMRPIFPIMGSVLIYAHVEEAVIEGQPHLQKIKEALSNLFAHKEI